MERDVDRPIVLDRVWKKFRLGERHDTLRDLLPALVKRAVRKPAAVELRDQEFWAVRDVSFSVARGEALGIIGPNGAGKSTALKLLTRILRPTRGECALQGRVGALIEVAAGFHPDLTGRENVFLQGAIMGMRRAEILRKFDEIVDFSGVRDFIDTPVKRYSSGMNARLGFAIAAHLDPDVLLIDEVLAVGDVAFQERCVERMRALRHRGIPIVFVSHNLPAVVDLCTRTIVLDHGSIVFDGSPVEATVAYRRLVSGQAASKPPNPNTSVRIAGVEIGPDDASASGVAESGGRLRLRIFYDAVRPTEAHFAVDIHTADGVLCSAFNSNMDRREFGVLQGRGSVDLVVPHLPLLPGCFSVSVGIIESKTLEILDVQFRAYPMTVLSQRADLGFVYIERCWEHRRLDQETPNSQLPTPKEFPLGIVEAGVGH